jgi:4'-phosphopantetheinyl transferase
MAEPSSVLDDFRPAALPAAPPGLREVHLWAVSLEASPEREMVLRRLLTREEAARADRFHFDRHRRRFIVRRGVLRLLLAAYLGDDPARVRFGEGEKGKPYVPQDAVVPLEQLYFNLSDSKDLAVYAFTRGAELGVDVEILRPMPDALQIAERFFSAEERECLRRVPPEATARAFFNCWTRKEAYIKAIGEGLSEPLDRFSVTLLPDEPARFVHLGGDRERAAAWTLHHLVPEDGAVGALALEGEGWRIGACCRFVP